MESSYLKESVSFLRKQESRVCSQTEIWIPPELDPGMSEDDIYTRMLLLLEDLCRTRFKYFMDARDIHDAGVWFLRNPITLVGKRVHGTRWGRYMGSRICINSDTSRDPPISRKGQALAIDNAASMESTSTIVYPDMEIVLPVETLRSEFTVFVPLSGFAGLTAESPNEASHSLYFAKCCFPSSGLDGGSPPR